jgi:hypothetical protein
MAGGGWKPIETAPRDESDILAWGPNLDCLVVSYDEHPQHASHVWATLDGLHYHRDAFTHWMPLPDPPESE